MCSRIYLYRALKMFWQGIYCFVFGSDMFIECALICRRLPSALSLPSPFGITVSRLYVCSSSLAVEIYSIPWLFTPQLVPNALKRARGKKMSPFEDDSLQLLVIPPPLPPIAHLESIIHNILNQVTSGLELILVKFYKIAKSGNTASHPRAIFVVHFPSPRRAVPNSGVPRSRPSEISKPIKEAKKPPVENQG